MRVLMSVSVIPFQANSKTKTKVLYLYGFKHSGTIANITLGISRQIHLHHGCWVYLENALRFPLQLTKEKCLRTL